MLIQEIVKRHGSKKVPSCITNGQAIFRMSGSDEISDRRMRDLKVAATEFMNSAAKMMVPNRPNAMIEAYLERRGNASEDDLKCLRQRQKQQNTQQDLEGITALVENLQLVSEKPSAVDIAIRRSAYNVYGEIFVAHLQELKPGKQRIQFLSFLVQDTTRPNCSIILDQEISKREWHNARQHARFPGAGKPPPLHSQSKLKVKKGVLDNLLRRLENSFQRFAFGQKVVKLFSGNMKQLDAVKLSVTLQNLVYEYLHEIATDVALELEENDVLDDLQRCPHREDRYRRRCYLQHEHTGLHKYTAKESVSPTTLRRLVTSLSAGEIQNLAGLDDEDVIKGYNNFRRLEEIAKVVFNFLQKSQKELEDFLKSISDVEIYHKTKFTRHASDNSGHLCGCLLCGFNCEDDPIFCEKRERNEHSGPCNDCTQSFAIFDILESMTLLASEQEHLSRADKEKFDELRADLLDCRQYLKHYRAHLILKDTEAKADDIYVLNLKDDEVQVICDWKMKILAMCFRENMQQFFGKKGTSCLGFMVVSNSASPDTKNVHFHFFLTNDTTQDAYSVLTAKYILYSYLLPDGVRKVHYKADGAGCFASNVSKAAMLAWGGMTGVHEISYRISVAGDWKSKLDGQFGVMTGKLQSAVQMGRDFHDAETIGHAIENVGGMKGCSFHIFSPVRSAEDDWTTEVNFLKQYTKLELLDDGNLQGYFHSQYGSGNRILADSINTKWAGGKIPSYPEYTWEILTSAEKNLISNQHSTVKNQIRKKEALEQQMTDNQNGLQEKVNAALEEQRKAGLFCCPTIDSDTGYCCTKVFSTANGLIKHEENGRHSFSSVNSRDYCILKVSEAGAMLSPNTLPDRALHTAAPIETIIDSTSEDMGLDWYCQGCYCKPGRKATFKKTKYLLEDLTRFFEYGLIPGNSKYEPEAALRELTNMKDPLNPDLPKYSRRTNNPHGPLPSSKIIKEWFSGQSIKRKKDLQSKETRQNTISSSSAENPTITLCSSTRVPFLKELLITNGLPATGKKMELYQRLMDHGIKF